MKSTTSTGKYKVTGQLGLLPGDSGDAFVFVDKVTGTRIGFYELAKNTKLPNFRRGMQVTVKFCVPTHSPKFRDLVLFSRKEKSVVLLKTKEYKILSIEVI